MTPKVIATALLLAEKGKQGEELDKVVARLLELLRQHNKQHLLPFVVAEVERQSTALRSSRTMLFVAAENDAATYKKQVHVLLQELAAPQEEDIATTVDPTLVGGFRLRSRGTEIDASYKRKLLSLYDTLLTT